MVGNSRGCPTYTLPDDTKRVFIAAVEAGLALGLVVLLYRARRTLDADAWSSMRG